MVRELNNIDFIIPLPNVVTKSVTFKILGKV